MYAVIEGNADNLLGILVQLFHGAVQYLGQLVFRQRLDKVVEGVELIGFAVKILTAADEDQKRVGVGGPDTSRCLHAIHTLHEDVQAGTGFKIPQQGLAVFIGRNLAVEHFSFYQGDKSLPVVRNIVADRNLQRHGTSPPFPVFLYCTTRKSRLNIPIMTFMSLKRLFMLLKRLFMLSLVSRLGCIVEYTSNYKL